MDLEWGPTDEQETIKAFNCQTKVGPRHLVEDRCGASHARIGSCKFIVRWNNENRKKYRLRNKERKFLAKRSREEDGVGKDKSIFISPQAPLQGRFSVALFTYL